jgi:hypothetical protein
VAKQLHFLVALGAPGSDTRPFSKYIQFQCNCCLFWRQSACQHALLLGKYLRKNAGGFTPNPIVCKTLIQSRVGVGVKGKARAAEYCHMAHPESTPALKTSSSRRGSVPTSLTQATSTLDPCPYTRFESETITRPIHHPPNFPHRRATTLSFVPALIEARRRREARIARGGPARAHSRA